MSRQQTLAQYIKDHEDLTIAEIGFIKEALIYSEARFGELSDDVELEVHAAIELYINHLNNK